MKVTIKGKGEINLGSNDFLASGGEGDVYAKSGMAYKIYKDHKKMIPVAKIKELAVLTHNNIIKPEDILMNDKNQVIGYNMKLVKNTYSLCQLFPKAFRQRENLSHQTMFDLVKKLQELVKHCHDNNILIVDLNEMNFLCDKKFTEIYAIDVDSYQTPSYHATALMESVRDRHSPNVFNAGTDWFSFGIVSFNMMIGIHPYKGKHDTLKTLDERMLKNVSVLNKSVSIPPVCYDIKIIPTNYFKWYEAIFEHGKRMSPPSENEFVQAIIAKVKTIVGNNKFDIKEVNDFVNTVSNYLAFAGVEIVFAGDSIFLNSKKLDLPSDYRVVGITPKRNNVVLAKSDNNKLKLFNMTLNKEIDVNMESNDLMSYNGIIYNKLNNNIVEINYMETGSNIVATPKVVCQVMPNSTTMFNGLAIQNMLGAYYVCLFPQAGRVHQVHIKELDGYVKIMDAKFDSGVVFVVATNSKGITDEIIIRFDEKYDEYDVRKRENITFTCINFVVLDNGVCITINNQEQIEIFSKNIHSSSMKIIDDPIINNDMILYKNGTQVLFANGTKVYTIKMK